MARKRTATKSRTRGITASGYTSVLAEMKDRIATARRRALATVNQELVALYWDIGRIIVRQQEQAAWGDAVVEQLSANLRAAFPDMKGLSIANIWRTRQFYLACRTIDHWLASPAATPQAKPLAAVTRRPSKSAPEKLASALRELENGVASPADRTILAPALRESRGAEKLATLSRELCAPALAHVIPRLSWTHQTIIMGAVNEPAERYFYMAMSIRERWSVRELRRQIDSDLFTRYVSVREHPEKCLPEVAEQGDLLPFKDHYILEFLGLEQEHSERELRKAILANLRDFFLEFGRDLTFVGEEYTITVGDDTFSIDLLFFHRRLQCLIAVDLKIGKFKPEYVGKVQFYCAALDEQIRLPHEKPSLGLVLCKTADAAQVRLALTEAAERIGVATYQTALPDEKRLQQRLMQLPMPTESDD